MRETLYEDRWITCEADRLVIRGPGKRKVIPYNTIRGVGLQPLALGNSVWRWGPTLNPIFWDPYFTDRPRPGAVLVLSFGRWRFAQYVIADHPMEVAGIIERHRNSAVSDE
jgi:hypothetical protein